MPRELLRVLGITPNLPDTSPGQRFRIEQWAPYLAERGIDLDFMPFESEEMHELVYEPGRQVGKALALAQACTRRACLACGLAARPRPYDVAYVFRESALIGPALLERWLVHLGLPYVYDFDDAVYLSYRSPANGYLSFLRFAGKTKTACRLASHVIAGNRILADFARQASNEVSIVPTTIELRDYVPLDHRPDRVLTIGWSGSYSTAQHLAGAAGALAELAKTTTFRLLAIGGRPPAVPGAEVEYRPWRSSTEVDDLHEIDVGIMPLPDDPWSTGKCALKALQYMALGIPTVCSPVGINVDIIRHGENGMLATSTSEWVECLRQLASSAAMRDRLGAAGRITVQQSFAASDHATRVGDIFWSAARGRKVRQRGSLMSSYRGMP